MRMIKTFMALTVLTALGVGGAWLHDPGLVRPWMTQAQLMARDLLPAREEPVSPWRTAVVEQDDIVSAVLATGTLRPVATVGVPATASGQITELNVDFNDAVTEGQPIALIDTALLEIAVDMAEAEFDMASASVETQRAGIRRSLAALDSARFDLRAVEANADATRLQVRDAENDLARRRAMSSTLSAIEVERAASILDVAQLQLRAVEAQADSRRAMVRLAEADVAAGESQLANLQAVLRQRTAALRQARLEYERSVVRAPVGGVVIGRNAEVGETVGNGMTLFTIAQDLRDMQVNASIDEAEIGRIVLGQRVEFTVDAYRGRVFQGQVDQIRMTPQTQANVVTYTVIVRAPNPELLLFPGMTASARFIMDERRDVLIVPNAALRFTPPGQDAPPGPHVWVAEAEGLRPVPVQRGLVDETRSEVSGPGLVAGMQVVTGIERQAEGPRGGRSLLGGT
jgi:HlyD family secretion protein